MILSNLTNMKRCFDLYIKNNLETEENLKVDYQGLPFNNSSYDSWVQPRIIDAFEKRSYRDDSIKQSATILFQINIFTKKSGITSSDMHYKIRDSVDRYFHIGQDIYYSDSGTTVSFARVREVVNDFSLEHVENLLNVRNLTGEELYQYVLTYEIDYNEL